MRKPLKVFILILFISIFAFNNYQVGYTESTQQAITNQPVFAEANNDANTQTIAEETADGLEYIYLINWLKQSFNLAEIQIGGISSQSLAPEYTLYIISLTDSARMVYIVIKDNQEIIEYGEGSFIPYLTNIICDNEIRELDSTNFLYFSPLESYWQFNYSNEVVNIDGATGEWLPQISNPITRDEAIKHFNISNTNTDYKKNTTEATFDPYEDIYWLLTDSDPNSAQLTLEDIIDSINTNQKIIYTGAKYDGMVSFAYPIIGYQNIDDLTYLALYDQYLDLVKYISYDELKQFGDFSIYQP